MKETYAHCPSHEGYTCIPVADALGCECIQPKVDAMNRNVQRGELLHIAAYDLPRFKSLVIRKQLPHPKFTTDRNEYPAILAIILVVGDMLVSETGLARDDFAQFGEAELVAMVGGFHGAIQAEGEWMGLQKKAGNYRLTFGKVASIMADLDDDAEAMHLLKVGPAFRAMKERADQVRPGLLSPAS